VTTFWAVRRLGQTTKPAPVVARSTAGWRIASVVSHQIGEAAPKASAGVPATTVPSCPEPELSATVAGCGAAGSPNR
jgi:hypothetical protein